MAAAGAGKKKIRLPYHGGDEMSRVFTEKQVNEAIACDVRYYMELWKKGLYSRSVDLKHTASHSVASLLMLRQHMGLATADEVSEALDDFNTFKETAMYEFIKEVSDE